MQNLGELVMYIGNLFGYALTKPFGLHEVAARFTKKISETEKDPIVKQVYLASLDMRNGRVDLAFDRYDAIMATLGEGENKFPRSLIEKMGVFFGKFPNYLFEKKDVIYYLNKSLMHFSNGETDKCKVNLEKAIAIEGDNKAEINLIYAFFLDLLGQRRKAIPYFARVADIVRQDKTLIFEPFGESKNEIIVIEEGKYLSKGIVIKRNESLEHLVGEREIIRFVEEDLNRNRHDLPNHIGEVEFREGKYETVMVRESITTLAQRLYEGHRDLEKNIDDACDFLAHIYKKVPLEILDPEISEIPKIVESLQEVGMDLDWIMELIEDLEPVFEGFENSRLVYRKDPHFWNWGVKQDGKIVAFDFEPAPATRLEKDLARFTDMCLLPKGLKKRIHSRVILELDPERDVDESRLLLYKGGILGTLKSYSVLSRGGRFEIRKVLLENAQLNLADIEKDYPSHFGINEEHYVNLGNKLVKLS